MWSPLKMGVAVLAVCAMSAASARGEIFTENFDTYATGSQMHGQGGWKGWDNGAAAGAVTSDAFAVSAPNSLNISGSADLVHEFDVVGGQLQFTAMQYIPTDFTGKSYFILLNTYEDNNSAVDRWSVQTSFDATKGIVTADYFEEGPKTLPLIYGEWVELRFDIDLDANTVNEYYGGQLLSSHPWQTDGAAALGAIDLFANGASAIYYDDISVVPEPTSLVLFLGLALGAAVMHFRRRR